MLDDCSYIDAQERLKHLRCIEMIAVKLNRPAEEVAFLYEEVLMQFAKKAVIRQYLTIFTSKKVKLIFDRTHNEDVTN